MKYNEDHNRGRHQALCDLSEVTYRIEENPDCNPIGMANWYLYIVTSNQDLKRGYLSVLCERLGKLLNSNDHNEIVEETLLHAININSTK